MYLNIFSCKTKQTKMTVYCLDYIIFNLTDGQVTAFYF